MGMPVPPPLEVVVTAGLGPCVLSPVALLGAPAAPSCCPGFAQVGCLSASKKWHVLIFLLNFQDFCFKFSFLSFCTCFCAIPRYYTAPLRTSSNNTPQPPCKLQPEPPDYFILFFLIIGGRPFVDAD